MEICGFPIQSSTLTRIQFNKMSSFKPVMNVKAQALNKSDSGDNSMFILGMGFVGQFFAADLKSKGWAVSGSCTSVEKKKNLEENGYQAYIFDANKPQREVLEVVKNHTHLLVSIPPVDHCDPLLGRDKKGEVESILKDGRLEWLGYLSSTSIYGDWGGAWVDESDIPMTKNAKGMARVIAENQWLSLGLNLDISPHVFRLGGIYGPGRSAVDTILKQDPLSKRQTARMSKSYTSRVHVADICQVIHASILKKPLRKIFNVVDDNPAPRAEVLEFAHQLLEEKFGKNSKRIIAPENSESRKVKGSKAGKRVSNSLIKKDLGVNLIHPSYRSGLRSIVEQMDDLSLLKFRSH